MRPDQKGNMARCLSGWLKNESIFYRILTVETASQHQLQSNLTGGNSIHEVAERFYYENVSDAEDHDQGQDSCYHVHHSICIAHVGTGIAGLILHHHFSHRDEDDDETTLAVR